MRQECVKEKVEELISCAKNHRDTMYVVMIASVQEKSNAWIDYSAHSVKTSYLARHELEEVIASFRNYSTYMEIYTDVEDFLKAYYTGMLKFRPTMVFESSSKGIGKGRDALVPTLCDLLQYPHIGSDAAACILCSSKYQWSSVLQANGVSVPDSYYFINNHWVTEPVLGKKYILKLNNECASIGLSSDSVMVYDGKNLTQKAKQLYKDYRQAIIAQTFVDGYEVEVPILINRKFQVVLPPIGLSVNNTKYHKGLFFDYDTIYNDNYSLYDFTSIEQNMALNLQKETMRIIDILDLNGYMRVDFRVCKDGRYYVIDINNDPCITSCGSFLKSIELLEIPPKDIAGILIGNRLI